MIYSTIVSIIFFCALAVWLVRFAGEAGVKYPEHRALAFITKKHTLRSEKDTTRRELISIFLFALIFRIIIFLSGWFALGIFTGDDAMGLLDYCDKWSIWDGPHYLEIAQYGYAHKIEDGNYYMLVFFPLYPLLIKLFAFVLRNYAVSALTVSALTYSAGCVMTYKLVTLDYSKYTARTAIVLLSIAPFAFFYGSVMTESLFFLLTVSTFYAIRRHNWVLAGILGALTALTRSFGVFMIIPAAVEWVQHEKPIMLIRQKQWRALGGRFVRVLPILVMPVGTLIYLFINYKTTGDALIFIKYQSEHWSMNLQFFGKTAHMLWDRTTSFNDNWSFISSLFMPELIAIPIFSLLILYSARRTRSVYTSFMLVYFVFNAGASWPLSMPRYLACMFPVYWVIAEFLERHKRLEAPLIAVSAVIFGIYLTGYITVHNIM